MTVQGEQLLERIHALYALKSWLHYITHGPTKLVSVIHFIVLTDYIDRLYYPCQNTLSLQ